MSSSRACHQCQCVLPEQTQGDLCQECQGTITIEPTESSPAPIVSLGKKRFGDYELIEEIAHGGMGVVYKARQISLNRIVALKMIRADRLAAPDDAKRFETEALASAQLQHPNIVAIYEIGDIDGQQFFSMTYMPGQTLTQLIHKQPVDPRLSAQYVLKVAEAIHYAHERGVLHRDIKPSNVLLDANNEPQVADFGLAKLMSVDSEMTASGAVMGSPSFMSPEQARGNHREIGVRSDVYALGAVLYSLLCGRPPFRGETMMETLRLVLDTEPVLPRVIVARVPRDLEIIVLKCLEKDPAKRYGSARELADDVRHFLRGEPITARAVSQTERVWRWAQRNPLLAAVSGTALALLLVVAIGAPIVAYNLNQAKILAQQGELDARRNAYAADMRAVQSAIEESRFGYALQLLDAHRPQPNEEDIRNWEWRYFWQLCQSDDLQTLTLHNGFVYAVNASHNGKWIASWEADSDVKIWSVEANREVFGLSNVASSPPQFSRDDRYLAIPTPSGEIRLLDMDLLQESTPSIKHPGSLREVGFHLDGKHLLSFGDGVIHYWDLDSRTKVKEVSAVKGNRHAFSEDWTLLAVSDNRNLMLWDELNGIRWTADTGHNSSGFQPIQLAFSPDEQWLAASIALNPGSGWTIQIWDVESGLKQKEFQAHAGNITDLAFSPDGRYLASTSYDQTTQVWETQNWQQITVLKGHNSPVFGVSFLPDGMSLITCSKDGTVRLWEVFPEERDRRLSLDQELCNGLIGETTGTASPDGSTLVMLRADGNGLFVDPLHLTVLREFVLPFKGTQKVGLGPGGSPIACGRENGLITLWDPDDGVVAEFQLESQDGLRQASFSPDGQWLATVDRDGTFKLWDLSTNREVESWHTKNQGGSSIAKCLFSPDSRKLAWGHKDGTLSLWDMHSALRIATFIGPDQSILAMAFSADGKMLGSTYYDSPARVWNLETLEKIAEFSGSQSSYFRIGFSPDGSRLYLNEWSIGRIMDISTKREVARLRSFYPMFLDKDTVFGLGENALWNWRPSELREIDYE